MGLFDFLFGKKPSSTLPGWAQNVYNNPAPQFTEYLRTGMLPEQNSSSGSSGFNNSQSNTQSKSNSTTNSRGISMPFFKPEELPIANALRSRIMGRMTGGSALPEAYKAMGLRNIGRTSESAMKGLEGSLAARNIDSGMGMENLYMDRSGQQSDFLNSIPLLERNLENEDLDRASGYLGSFGTGVSTQNQSTTAANTASQTNTNSQSGSSGWSNSPAQFDYAGYGGMLGSLMPYYTSGRQGGLLTPELLGSIFGTLFGGKK